MVLRVNVPSGCATGGNAWLEVGRDDTEADSGVPVGLVRIGGKVKGWHAPNLRTRSSLVLSATRT